MTEEETNNFNKTELKTFSLIRRKDLSGYSGTGKVLEGVIFEDGTTVVRWMTDTPSTAIYFSFDEFNQLHNHEENKSYYIIYDSVAKEANLEIPTSKSTIVECEVNICKFYKKGICTNPRIKIDEYYDCKSYLFTCKKCGKDITLFNEMRVEDYTLDDDNKEDYMVVCYKCYGEDD